MSSLKMVPSHSTGRPVPARTACTVMAGDPQSRRPWGLSPAPVRRALAFPWEQLLPGPRRQFAGRGFGFRGKAEAGHFHQTVCRTGSHWLPKDRGDLRGSKPLTGADSGEQLAGLWARVDGCARACCCSARAWGRCGSGEVAPLTADVCLGARSARPPPPPRRTGARGGQQPPRPLFLQLGCGFRQSCGEPALQGCGHREQRPLQLCRAQPALPVA